MGIDVELRRHRQLGTSPRRATSQLEATLASSDGVLNELLERISGSGRTPMLDRIDPFRDLNLTHDEMPQLLTELAILATTARTPAERGAVQDLIALAERCRDDRALRLHFWGD